MQQSISLGRLLGAGVMLAAAGCGGGGSDANQPPAITAPADVTVSANDTSAAITFSVRDDDGADRLTLSATSADPALLDNDGIVLAGSGRDRSLTVAPVAGRLGTTSVTIRAVDADGAGAAASFQVTVVAQNVSFSGFFRETFLAPETDEPRDINSREFDRDARDGEFDDLVASP